MDFNRKCVVFLATSVCAFLLCIATSYGAQELKKIRLVHDGLSVATAVTWVGMESGLFEEYGLDVEEIFIQNASNGGVEALLGVDLFLGSGNPIAPLQKIIGGSDIVFLGSHANLTHYKFGISAGITSLGDLKGKKIGMSGIGGRSDLIARVVLRRAGIDPVKEVDMVSVGYSPARAAALSRNLIQGAPLSPQVALEAERLGIKVLNIRAVPIITALLITTRSIIKRDEKILRSFMKGYLAATHYYLTHREESIRIMREHVSVADSTVLDAMYSSLADQLAPWPAPNMEAVQALLDAAGVIDEKAEKLKPADLFELRFIQELKASGFIEDLYAEKIKL